MMPRNISTLPSLELHDNRIDRQRVAFLAGHLGNGRIALGAQ